MENTILLYLLKVSVALLFFSIAYTLWLRKDTFVKTRRYYFLFALTFALLYPLLVIELPVQSENYVIPAYWLSQVEVGVGAEANIEHSINYIGIALIAGAVVSGLLLLRFIVQIISIIRLRVKNEKQTIDGVTIINVSDIDTPPSSFFGWIFINQSLISSNRLVEILNHESAHVQQKHTFDILFSELFCICFWWNPLAWYFRSEIKVNLEYLADKAVLHHGCDSRKYQYMLLNTLTNCNGIPITNNFNVSQLKKRITMMNKKQTSFSKSMKYLAVLPLSLALVLGNSVQASGKLTDLVSDSSVLSNNASDPHYSVPFISVLDIKTNGEIVDIRNTKKTPKDGEPYNLVEQMPVYPGGYEAMFAFIKNNLKYPQSAQDANIEGRVVVRFVVNADGTISDAKVLGSLDSACDAEALRTVNAMPKWEPGKEKGKFVSVYYTLPIAFKLTKDGTPAPKETTISENTLILLDGKVITNDELSKVSTNSIEQVSVIKDLAAVATYGDVAKGKDAIIIITSKK